MFCFKILCIVWLIICASFIVRGHQLCKFFVGLVLSLLVLGCNSFARIPTGMMGVQSFMGGKTSSVVLEEGFRFKNPFAEIYLVDTKLHRVRIDHPVRTVDNQRVEMPLEVQFGLHKESAYKFVEDVGTEEALMKNIFEPYLAAVSTDVAARCTTAQLQTRQIESQDGVSAQPITLAITQELTNQLNEVGFISIGNVAISDVDFSTAYDKAIERRQALKVLTDQVTIDIEQARFQQQVELEKAGQEVAKTVADAEAKAEVIKYEAQKKAEAVLAEGEAQVAINTALDKSLSWEAMLDSILPKADKIALPKEVYVVPAGTPNPNLTKFSPATFSAGTQQ